MNKQVTNAIIYTPRQNKQIWFPSVSNNLITFNFRTSTIFPSSHGGLLAILDQVYTGTRKILQSRQLAPAAGLLVTEDIKLPGQTECLKSSLNFLGFFHDRWTIEMVAGRVGALIVTTENACTHSHMDTQIMKYFVLLGSVFGTKKKKKNVQILNSAAFMLLTNVDQ